MVEPAKVLMHAALSALEDSAVGLRQRGWNVDVQVDTEPGLMVSMRIHLPDFPIPVEFEARKEGTT